MGTRAATTTTLYLGAGTLFLGPGIDVKIRKRKVTEVNLAG